jgi:3-phenylpropionate/trans-cinnamate dioxygenase ferredoxin subunit
VVGRASEIGEGERRIVVVRGRSYGVFNVDGSFYALLNRCPHHGAELCKGPLVHLVEADVPGDVRFDGERRLVQCPWHGWEFDVRDGRSYCDPEKARVRTYPAEVDHGDQLTRELDEGLADNGTLERETVVPGGVANSVVTPRPVPGPFKAETVPVSVEDDYVILHLPR